MIKNTLYAKYIKEREGAEVIENENGFVTYKIVKNECFLINIFSEKRQNGCARDLIDLLTQEAIDHKCDCITANVYLSDPNVTITTIFALKLGFKIVTANNNVLLIVKEVK